MHTVTVASVPLTFAIGDLHGCHRALCTMLRAIHAYARHWRPHAAYRIIFLGDYVDRGPQSAHVVQTLINMQADGDTESRYSVHCLQGNHDAMLWQGLLQEGELADGDCWMSNGGVHTLQSYASPLLESLDFVHAPNDEIVVHARWLRDLPTMIVDDAKRVFVHAGVNANLSLDEQTECDLLWSRNVLHSQPDDYYVVHGHSIVGHYEHGHDPRRVMVAERRCNVDLGCCVTHLLGCAVFDDVRLQPVATVTVDERANVVKMERCS